jgi:type II secretory pathway pseudopilin PulG
MKNSQKGQTIIEAVVALVTILLIITAIAIVIVSGLYNSSFIKNQNEANKYAQQAMEAVRNVQSNDLVLFRTVATTPGLYCLNEADNSITNQNCTEGVINLAGNFNRVITFSNDTKCNSSVQGTEATKVTVVVSWISSKCPSSNTFCHKSELVSCMPYRYPASNP